MFSKTFLSIVALAASVSANCIHATSFSRRQEKTVTVSNFGYTGLQGPTNWAALDPANSACATSKVQSPINIDATVQKAAEAPQVVIAPVAAAEFENLGTTTEVIVSGNTTFAGATFELRQFHMHTPSEHRIGEEYFPLELHFVHEGANGQIAVIAQLFQLSEDGSTTDLLTNVIQNIDQIATPGTATTTGPLDFTEFINHVQTTPLFQYTGSLTTPPCAEGLIFLVSEQPLPINVATYNKIKSVIKFNSRFTQNTLGETNLLQVASEFAVQSGFVAGVAGAGLEPAGGAAAANNTGVISSDAQAIIDAIAAGQQINIQDLTFETVTQTVTKIRAGGQAGRNVNNNNRGGKNDNKQEGKNNGQKNNEQKGKNNDNKKEAPKQGEVKPAAGGEVKPAPGGEVVIKPQVGGGQPVVVVAPPPKAEQQKKENEHLVQIQRSRLARAPSFRRRSEAGKRRF